MTSTDHSHQAAGVLNRLSGGLGSGLVPPEIFGDEALYKQELEQIFGRLWVFVAFESEIPNPGDFVLRNIGEDQFIIIRGTDGKVRALLDMCSHRGARLAYAERGNSVDGFTCLYHGWSYNIDGDLIGAPLLRQAYGSTLDKRASGLRVAPRIESLHGFIFVSLDAEGLSFDEWLGDARWYLDVIFGIFDGGMEVVGEPQRWVIDANWKIGGDNFIGDDYHTLNLHKSMFQLGSIPLDPVENMKGYHIQLKHGHGLSYSMPGKDEPLMLRYLGYPEEIVARMKLDSLNEGQRYLAERSRVAVGTIFPNLSFLTLPVQAHPEAPYTTFMSVRQWQPMGPKKMQALSWQLVPKGASEEFKRASYHAGIATFGSAGTFEQDDTIPWTSITSRAGSVAARKLGANLNYQMGMPGHGLVSEAKDFPGPGTVMYPRWEEGNQRNYLRAYLDVMQAR